MTLAILLGAFMVLLDSSVALASTIVDTFEADGGYSVGRSVVSTRDDPRGTIPGVRGIIPGRAHSFLAPGSSRLERVDLALVSIVGTRDVELAIFESNGGIPETLVVSEILLDALGPTASVISWETSAQLRADTLYFLAVSIPLNRQPSAIGWQVGMAGDSGFARAALAPDRSGWLAYQFTTFPRGAMRVHVNPIPEPGAALLFISGFACLACRLGITSH